MKLYSRALTAVGPSLQGIRWRRNGLGYLERAIQTRGPVALVSPEPLTRRTMPYEDQDHTHKIAGSQIRVPNACGIVRHSTLWVLCRMRQAPESIFEGITASKGYTNYWSRVPPIGAPTPVDGNRTLFHILSQDENRDRE